MNRADLDGILPRWHGRSDVAAFRQALEDKPPYQDWLRAIPSYIVMHPQPMNRGIEIASEVADGPQSVIRDQVRNGVAVRMAVLESVIEGRK